MIKICFRVLTEREDNSQQLPDQEIPISFYPRDILVVDMGGENIYTFSLHGGLLLSKFQTPPFVDELVEMALKSGRIQLIQSDNPPESMRWRILAHAKKTHGLCACDEEDLNPGDFVQLWTGEIMQFTSDRRLEHVPGAWTPGRDETPPQKSRY